MKLGVLRVGASTDICMKLLMIDGVGQHVHLLELLWSCVVIVGVLELVVVVKWKGEGSWAI